MELVKRSCEKQDNCEVEFCDDSSGTPVCTCEDSITSNNDNSTSENALLITELSWNETGLTTSTNSCEQADDWYKIEAKYGEKITSEIRFIDDNGDLDLYLYDSSFNQVDWGFTRNDIENVENIIALNNNGLYYLKVDNAQNIYDMSVRKTCATDFSYNSTLRRCIPNECELVSTTRKRYLYCSVQKSWTEARDICSNYQFYLATIDSSVENTRLSDRIGDNNTWIGLNDRADEGVWKWVEDDSSLGTSNWASDEPGVGPIKDCVQMYGNGTWNDQYCTNEYFFICEKDRSN